MICILTGHFNFYWKGLNIMNTYNEQIERIKTTAINVITNPAGFFQNMAKGGGFADPVVFLAAVGVVSGIIQAVLSIIGIGYPASFFVALGAILWVPVVVVVFSFVGASIFFVIWKLMGSDQSYETAYRCVAYAGAITPITMLLSIVPYLGSAAGLLWMMFLMVTASQAVHQLESQRAWTVFGIMFGLFILLNLNSQHMARNAEKQVEHFNRQMQQMENMTPEEAGRAMGEFFKGFNEGSGKE